MKKYIYATIATILGCLDATIIASTPQNAMISIVGMVSLFGTVIFMTMCASAIDEESYDEAIREYVNKVTKEISTLKVRNEILEQCLKKKGDKTDECE